VHANTVASTMDDYQHHASVNAWQTTNQAQCSKRDKHASAGDQEQTDKEEGNAWQEGFRPVCDFTLKLH